MLSRVMYTWYKSLKLKVNEITIHGRSWVLHDWILSQIQLISTAKEEVEGKTLSSKNSSILAITCASLWSLGLSLSYRFTLISDNSFANY